ncbi:MAG: P-loop NTPase [Alphaproteobacteria bacterium]|jgi:receptor protein-tyrosine kinase|nr:P-loop NTPase [Alphaproteobacteria bacterium]
MAQTTIERAAARLSRVQTRSGQPSDGPEIVRPVPADRARGPETDRAEIARTPANGQETPRAEAPHAESPRPVPLPGPGRQRPRVVRANGAVPPQGAAVVAGPGAGNRKVAIDFDRLERMGFISPRKPVTRTSEEMRMVKRPLLKSAFANPDPASLAATKDNVIMVTSALPREGKSFIAVNLAISLAIERDIHVMLIDADVVRPSVFSILGLEENAGLIDVLEDRDMDLGQAIVRTNIGKLSLVSAGKSHMLTTELLASDRMGQLIEEMASRYRDRIVIFDTPPLLAASESSVLAHRVGQVLLVVQADRTGESSVQSALDLIEDCPRVSMLLNKASSFFAGLSFGSHYSDYQRSLR